MCLPRWHTREYSMLSLARACPLEMKRYSISPGYWMYARACDTPPDCACASFSLRVCMGAVAPYLYGFCPRGATQKLIRTEKLTGPESFVGFARHLFSTFHIRRSSFSCVFCLFVCFFFLRNFEPILKRIREGLAGARNISDRAVVSNLCRVFFLSASRGNPVC